MTKQEKEKKAPKSVVKEVEVASTSIPCDQCDATGLQGQVLCTTCNGTGVK